MASSKDFVANQIRSAKLIMTGTQSGDGGIGVRNISLAVYDESITLNNEGDVTDSNLYNDAGTDVAIVVSGSGNSRGTNATAGGVVLFGGDTYISGTLVVENAGRTFGSISGSIHHTADGIPYLVAGTDITISSASNGQVTISSTAAGGGGGDASLNYYDEYNGSPTASPFAAGNHSVVIGDTSLADASSVSSLVFGTNNTGSTIEMSVIGGGESNKIYNLGTAPRNARGIVIAGGQQNEITGSSSHSTIGGGFGNVITGSENADNQAGFDTISGGSDNRITGSHSSIGGGRGNTIISNQGTIAGGELNLLNKIGVLGAGFIGGGSSNTGSSEFSSIAGGQLNKINNFSDFSFIGGGQNNLTSGNSGNDNVHYATIGGGQFNKISAVDGQQAPNSSILGGRNNEIEGSDSAAILGGEHNLIQNNHNKSLLMGQYLTSSAPNQTILGYGSTFPGTGYVVASGSFLKSDGLNGGAITGSITRTKEGLSYLVAGANMTITSQSNGQVIFESSGGGGGGANTLDQAYDEGGAGAGRIITADSGPVQIDASGNSTAGLAITGSSGGDLIDFKVSSNLDAKIKHTTNYDFVIENTAGAGGSGAGHIILNAIGGNANVVLGNASNLTRLVFNGNEASSPSSPYIYTSNAGNAADLILDVPNNQAVVINEDAQASDFRVEGDTLQGAILVDGGESTVVLGSDTTTFAGLPAEAKGNDVTIVLSGSTDIKNNSAFNKRGVILATGDLVTSGTFYANSIDAGERQTYALRGSRNIQSGSAFACFSNTFSDGKEILNNGIPHYELLQPVGGNVQGYACITTVPSGSKGVFVRITAISPSVAGGYSYDIRMSGSMQQLGTAAPTVTSAPPQFGVAAGSIVTGGKYFQLTGSFSLEDDLDMPSPRAKGDTPGIFGIFRRDTSDNANLQILTTEFQFKM